MTLAIVKTEGFKNLATVGVSGFSQLKEKALEYLPPEKMAVIEDAYHFASEAHQGQVRKSGSLIWSTRCRRR